MKVIKVNVHRVVKTFGNLCSPEVSIIDEYERNLLFEQQYISSVVEGMEDSYIICPICHM